MNDCWHLEAQRLGFERAGRPVLQDVSLKFNRAEWTAIVGPNGAGKSTLLALLAGLLRATSGVVRLNDRPIEQWRVAERARMLTWSGEPGAVASDFAALEIAWLGRLPWHGLLGARGAADEAAVMSALRETDTLTLASRRISDLSAGERQRVLLARAFAASAPILLLDEPTLHLDAPHQRQLIRSLRERALRGYAVVSILHDLNLALAADRVVVMAGGRLCADGRPDDATIRDTMSGVFDHAFSIERASGEGGRWTALPNLDFKSESH